MSDKILVEACEGRVVPLHRSDAPNGADNFQLKPEDGAVEVPNTSGIRRRVRAGDLRVVPPMAERVDALIIRSDNAKLKQTPSSDK